jgi:hypothetical protein
MSRRTDAAEARENTDESLVVSPGDFLERLFRLRRQRRRVRQRRSESRLRGPNGAAVVTKPVPRPATGVRVYRR